MDALQSAGEFSQFDIPNLFESSPLRQSVMTFGWNSLDIKKKKKWKMCLLKKKIKNAAVRQCKRDIYSKKAFLLLNIIDYFLYFTVCLEL